MSDIKHMKPISDEEKRELSEHLSKALIPLQKTCATLREVVLKSSFAELEEALLSLGKIAQNLLKPKISDEELKKRISAYEAWGNYGWVEPPDSPPHLFLSIPDNQETANSIVMQYCKPHNTEEIFAEVENQKHVRKSDLREAKFCFDNKKYKSCAMLLFAMTDARLIRLFDKIEKKRRPSGKAAAKQIIDHILLEYSEVNGLSIYLRLHGLLKCTNCVWAFGDDFRMQPSTINRNYILHGMRWKNVTRTECIQALLLYYELIVILDTLHVKKISMPS